MKNVVFIPNIDLGNGRSTPYHYSVKSWANWAKQYGYEVFEWTTPIMDPNTFPIIMQREWVFDILEHNKVDYEQVLVVDADTIVHPNCPDFFLETDFKYSAVVNNGCYEWVSRSKREWGKAMFPDQPNFLPQDYLNTGFVIVNKSHRWFLEKVQELYILKGTEIKRHRDRIKASTGQTIMNFMLKKYDIGVTKLSEAYNLQDLFRKNLLHIPGHSWWSDELHFLDAGWVYHFNAIPKNPRDVSYWMERTYKYLYE